MGVDLSIRIGHDPDDYFTLDRSLTYALLKRHDGGLLWSWLSPAEQEDLFRDPDVSAMSGLEPGGGTDPAMVAAIVRKLRVRLAEENDQLPVIHFLKVVDGDQTELEDVELLIPSRFELEETRPTGPIVRLDGYHRDPNHRMDLRRYRVLINHVKLKERDAEIEHYMNEQLAMLKAKFNIKEGDDYCFGIAQGHPALPLEEEVDGWVPVQPVLEILGRRIAVRTVDKLTELGPQLDQVIALADQAAAKDLPFVWSIF